MKRVVYCTSKKENRKRATRKGRRGRRALAAGSTLRCSWRPSSGPRRKVLDHAIYIPPLPFMESLPLVSRPDVSGLQAPSMLLTVLTDNRHLRQEIWRTSESARWRGRMKKTLGLPELALAATFRRPCHAHLRQSVAPFRTRQLVSRRCMFVLTESGR